MLLSTPTRVNSLPYGGGLFFAKMAQLLHVAAVRRPCDTYHSRQSLFCYSTNPSFYLFVCLIQGCPLITDSVEQNLFENLGAA
jgi:hypothetical protein